MKKQKYYKEEYKKINPKWVESINIYKDLISRCVKKDAYILDVGCGHSKRLAEIYGRTKNTYGIDPDPHALTKNTLIKYTKQISVEDMDFKDNFFDVVVLAWVIEHLPNPRKAFEEINRVLKPGGSVIFITPNTLNYNAWIIRLVPVGLHKFFTKKLYGREEHDTFPTKYRFNSIRKIEKEMKEIGFKRAHLITNGDPSYISFNKLTFKIATLLEKILNKRPFKKCRVHIIGQYTKV